MKSRVTTVICAAALVCATSGALADQKPESQKPSTALKAVDAIFVRPVCLASTVAGSAVFVLTLPVTAITKEVKPAANELIHKPAYKTFKRPLGDMQAMAD